MFTAHGNLPFRILWVSSSTCNSPTVLFSSCCFSSFTSPYEEQVQFMQVNVFYSKIVQCVLDVFLFTSHRLVSLLFSCWFLIFYSITILFCQCTYNNPKEQKEKIFLKLSQLQVFQILWEGKRLLYVYVYLKPLQHCFDCVLLVIVLRVEPLPQVQVLCPAVGFLVTAYTSPSTIQRTVYDLLHLKVKSKTLMLIGWNIYEVIVNSLV